MTLTSLHISISWNSKYLIPKWIRILLKKFLNKGSESKYPVSQILTILPIHHQLRQVITICLILPFNCMLINWHVLGTWLPQSWQSLDEHFHSSVRQVSSICQLLDICLASVCQLFCTAWQVIAKHLASKHQAHAKRVACNWKAAWSRLVLQLVGGLYAKICPLKMASDYINMVPKDQGNVRYISFIYRDDIKIIWGQI